MRQTVFELVRVIAKLLRVEANADKGIAISKLLQEMTEAYEDEERKRQERVAKGEGK